ncbi:MAG TPA: hypothetical protein VKG84_05730 [Candidatus Acidoferrales bacterium]|nr:hypothetical protein [Candidatus Acidoferrales bacterium]
MRVLQGNACGGEAPKSQSAGSGGERLQQSSARDSGHARPLAAAPGLFPGDTLGDIPDERKLESLTLVGLHHAKNPENESCETDEVGNQHGNRSEEKDSAKTEDHEQDPEQNVTDNMQATEENQGLRGVEAYKGTLVNQ